MTDLNEAQRLCAEHYGDGDFSYVTTLDECRSIGDGLFLFLMIELSDKEGCSSLDEALRRLRTAKEDIQSVINPINRAAISSHLRRRGWI